MRRFITLVESQLNESEYFLTTPVENIIDQVMDAKIETGEELPEDEQEALDLVIDNINQAQRTLRPYVQNGKIAVHRALVVTPEWLEALQPVPRSASTGPMPSTAHSHTMARTTG
jgi:hypothetical protein